MNVESIISAVNRPNAAPGDYVGPDGLLRCGACHEPKQFKLDGVAQALSIPCRCAQERAEADAAAAASARIEELRKHCLLSEAARRRTFAAGGDAKHLQTLARYAAKWSEIRAKNIGLLLYGPTGTGKTYAAQALANALLDRNIPVRYLRAVDLAGKLMDRETRREEFMERVKSVPLLILDDVGAERGTPYAREQICAVIDARVEACKPLVTTTNLTPDEMRGETDPGLARMYDRILGCCVPIAVTGGNFRAERARENLAVAKALLEDGS